MKKYYQDVLTVLLNLVKKILSMRWLWAFFTSFYLVAYTFWIPSLFDDLLIVIPISFVTLFIGGGLFLEGLWRVLELEKTHNKRPKIPGIRIWWFAGGIMMIGYLLVYVPEEGRLVAHWPLDLAITIMAGIIALAYSVKPIQNKG